MVVMVMVQEWSEAAVELARARFVDGYLPGDESPGLVHPLSLYLTRAQGKSC
jgi:hypothetical protein